SRAHLEGSYGEAAIRSAIVLKALTHAPTGAMVAAPTTSLPEVLSGDRNWDYRYSWVRDSSIAVRSLAELGFDAEADGFRRLVEGAATRWTERDRGIWETRKAPQHFVHSKVMCWAAVDRGIRLAKEGARKAPTRRWTKARDEMRTTIESRGYDRRRGVFRRAFGTRQLDGALLLIPSVGFVDYDDPRMIRTT